MATRFTPQDDYNINKNKKGQKKSYLLRTKVLRASPSTSSATMTKGLRCWLAISRAGTILWTVEIFFMLSSR